DWSSDVCSSDLDTPPYLHDGRLLTLEEFHGVIKGQEAAIVQIGRRVLDATEREGLDGSVGGGHHAIDHLGPIEPLRALVVHEFVRVVGRRVSCCSLALAV